MRVEKIEFIEFTGEEKEVEYLEKCLLQWEKINGIGTETQRLICIGSIFHDMRHRLEELKQRND